MGRPSRETVMTALFNALVAAVQANFTADTVQNSVELTNVSSTAGLFVGLPVMGGSIPEGAVIETLSPLTLSLAAGANGSAVSMTTGFQTTGRRLKMWDDVAAQPALFLRDGDEDLSYTNTVFQAQTIKAEVWIYSRAGANPDIAPIIALNNLLDAIQAAFAPDDPSQQRFTLGGLVNWCRLEGQVMKEPGDLDGQAIACVEALITVP